MDYYVWHLFPLLLACFSAIFLRGDTYGFGFLWLCLTSKALCVRLLFYHLLVIDQGSTTIHLIIVIFLTMKYLAEYFYTNSFILQVFDCLLWWLNFKVVKEMFGKDADVSFWSVLTAVSVHESIMNLLALHDDIGWQAVQNQKNGGIWVQKVFQYLRTKHIEAFWVTYTMVGMNVLPSKFCSTNNKTGSRISNMYIQMKLFYFIDQSVE